MALWFHIGATSIPEFDSNCHPILVGTFCHSIHTPFDPSVGVAWLFTSLLSCEKTQRWALVSWKRAFRLEVQYYPRGANAVSFPIFTEGLPSVQAARVIGTIPVKGSFAMTGWPTCVFSGSWSFPLFGKGHCLLVASQGKIPWFWVFHKSLSGYWEWRPLVWVMCPNWVVRHHWDVSILFNQTFSLLNDPIGLGIIQYMKYPLNSFPLSPE